MLRVARFVAIAGVAAAAVALPSSAIAADVDGCSGSFTSKGADNETLDTATAPGDGGTQADPFVIDPGGVVEWSGSTDDVITDATWAVTVGGLPFRSGTFANAEKKKDSGGTQSMSILPTPVVWLLQTNVLVPVSGSISGDGGSCEGSGWITGTGNPLSSPLAPIGGGLAAGGLLLGAGMVAGTRIDPTGGAQA